MLSPSFDGGGDSPRSVNSANSFETLASTGDLWDEHDGPINTASAASAASAAAEGGRKDRTKTVLGVVDRTLFESWKELPWQARVCPRAIEAQEVVRRTAALEAESLRVQSWRQAQQALATSAARDEERSISGWWRQEAEQLWALQLQRRRDHVELATRQEVELDDREKQGAELLSVGYGQELARLDGMDQSAHLERLERIETLFAIAVRENAPEQKAQDPSPEDADSSDNCESEEDGGAIMVGSVLPAHSATADAGGQPSKEQAKEAVPCANVRQVHQHQHRPQQRGGGVQVVQRPEKEGDGGLDSARIERICDQAQSELERIELHASEVAAVAESFSRRRQSLACLLYRGLAAVYRDLRAAARRIFVSECAADIARIKQLASSLSPCSSFSGAGKDGGGGGGSGAASSPPARRTNGVCSGFADNRNNNNSVIRSGDLVGLTLDREGPNENPTTTAATTAAAAAAAAAAATAEATSPEAARSRELRRVTQELRNETDRVAFWDKLQREVLRRSTSEVTKLLAADSLRRAPVEGSRSRPSGGAESIQALRRRARASMRELRGRQATARVEARSIERSWMSALARWAGQLEKARAAAIRGEIAELRILQREDAEALAAQENAAVSALAKRREALVHSWDNLLEAEHARIADTAGAWRHCVLGACTMLRALMEESQRERSSATESWEDEHARARERSRLLADVVDREQRVIDDGHSLLLEELAIVAADHAEKEARATAAASRNWWAEARERLLSLFVSAHDSRQACQESRLSPCSEDGEKAVAGVNAVAVNRPAPEEAHAPASSASLPLIRDRLDELLREEEIRAAKAAGDILAAGSREEARERGPLHHAAAETQRLSSEAIGRCLDAVEAARSEPFADGGKGDARSKEARATKEDDAKASFTEGSGSDSGSGDGGRRRGTHTAEQEPKMDLFLPRLEAGAVQLAAASFEAEVGRLAVGPGTPLTAAEVVTSLPPPPDTTIEQKARLLLLEDGPPPNDLTRSQLDLRRTVRVKDFARALGEMLCRVSEALQKKAFELRDANEKEYAHNRYEAISRHSQRVGELQARARAQGEEALRDALRQVEARSKERSSRFRAVAAIRRRAAESAIGWIDAALTANLRRLERRRRIRREQEQRRAGTLENFGRAALEEEREWLLRVREQRREASEVARSVVSDHIAEIIDQHRRQKAAAAAAEVGEAAAAAQEDEEKGEEGLEGVMVTADGAALGGGYADGGRTYQPTTNDSKDNQWDDANNDDDNNDDVGVAAPSLDDRIQAEVMAAMATVEGSCLAGVDAWAEQIRRHARELESSLAAEMASHDREEHAATTTEVEALELAFRAARKDAEEAVATTDYRVSRLPPGRKDCDDSGAVTGAAVVGTTTTAAGPRNLSVEGEARRTRRRRSSSSSSSSNSSVENETARKARDEAEEPMPPDFVAKEQEECRILWSSFEPLLTSLRLELSTTDPIAGETSRAVSQQRQGRDQQEEDEEEWRGEQGGARRESAVRMVASLESDLRDDLAETFSATGKGDEARAMVRGGNEELRLAFVAVAHEERLAKRKEKDRALGLLMEEEENEENEEREEDEEEERRRGIERAEAERARKGLLLVEEGLQDEEEGDKAKAIKQESVGGAAVLGVEAGGLDVSK